MNEKEKDYYSTIMKLDIAHDMLSGRCTKHLKPKTAKKLNKLIGDMVDLLIAIEKESGLFDD